MEDLDLGATIRGFVAGQKVFSRYTLLKQLGRGGMGVVWRARDESLEQDVAIKMLPEIVANDPASVRELKRETSRNQQLSHPHILRVFDFVEAGALCGITMEVAEGGTLTQRRLDQPGEHFEVADIREWVRQLCDALDHAHRRAKVVHRDLKPANLMLTASGELKVTDFGIAASLSESVTRVSKQGSSSGTPLYMSPQQMMGDKPAVTDDLYSLGATLFELLTGKPPFFSGNVILQVQNKTAPSVAERRRDLEIKGAPIQPEWEETIAACLAKDPKDRPQTAREVWDRLAAAPWSAAAERPSGNGPRLPMDRPRPMDRVRPASKRTAWYAAITAAAALAAGAAWWFGVKVPERDRQEEAAAQARAAEAQQAQAADAEYSRMKALVARLTPDLAEKEMEALNTEVTGYFNHGGGTTPRHLEIRDELSRRYDAWQAANNQRRQSAVEAEQKRLAHEEAVRAKKDDDEKQALERKLKDLISRGSEKTARRDWDGAIADFDQAVALDPNQADVFGFRGAAKYAKGDRDGAIADFSRAIALNPALPLFHFNRGAARHSKGDNYGAIVDFNRTLELDPKYSSAYAGLGAVKYSLGDFDRAIADFDRAIAIDPTASENYAGRGNARYAQRDVDGAIADYSQAIKLDPKLSQPYVGRGTAKYAKRDLDGAIMDFNRAILLSPTSSPAYRNRATAKYGKGDIDGAIADYDRAIALDPKLGDAYVGRGTAKYSKQDLDGAIADFDRGIELDPKTSQTYTSRGSAKYGKRDLDGAIADFDRAIALDPKQATNYLVRGAAKSLKEDWHGSLGDLDRAIALDPRSESAFSWRAIVRRRMGDLPGAEADEKTATALKANSR